MNGDEAKYQCYITSKFNARWHTAKWIERILAEGMGRLYKCRWREEEACRKGLPPVFSRVFWLSSHPTQTKGIHVVVYVLENKRMFNIIFIQNTSDHKYCKWQIYCPPYTYLPLQHITVHGLLQKIYKFWCKTPKFECFLRLAVLFWYS